MVQSVLKAISDHKFNPEVLLDLLRSLYALGGMTYEVNALSKFGTEQTFLSSQTITNFLARFAQHFAEDRRVYGLHGLYPKYSDHCSTIRGFIASLIFAFVPAVMKSNVGLPPEMLANMIWLQLWEVFSPWIAPYFLKNVQVANWMKQLTDGDILQPWSKPHTAEATKYLQLFVQTIQYVLNLVPGMHILLGYVFDHYEACFANPKAALHVLEPVHETFLQLPWEHFRPFPAHVEGFHRILQQFLPESHAFVGKVFLQLDWTVWLQQHFDTWSFDSRRKIMPILLAIFLKISLEPSVRKVRKALQIDRELIKNENLERKDGDFAD